MFKLRFVFAASTLIFSSLANSATLVTSTSFSNEDSLINGHTIEDFEDTSLIDGLTITWGGSFETFNTSVAGSVSVSGSLPKIFDPTNTATDCPVVNGCPFNNNVWDGQHALTNGGFDSATPTVDDANSFNFLFASLVEFSFDSPLTGVGIGLSNFQTNLTTHSMFVNGVNVGLVESLSTWVSGVNVRNSYVYFQATEGDTISSIAFQNNEPTDGLVFDKLAISKVPEPSIL